MANLTLNIMSLGGLALGVGMLVDNSIVMLENIFRKRDEEGIEDPVEARVTKARPRSAARHRGDDQRTLPRWCRSC